MEEPPVLVHHKGRRFRRSLARTNNTVNDAGHTSLPPPTPPSGKSRDSMQVVASKTSFPYQRFKPLPSIGSTHQMQGSSRSHHSDVIISADSAVNLTSPSPTVSSTEIRVPTLSISTRTANLRSDRKHSHMSDSRSSSREGRSATKTAKIDTKPPVVTTTQGATSDDEARVRRTRGSSKSKVKSKSAVSKPIMNFEIPPEPSADDPHTVVIKLRLPGGECIQRRFNYQVDRLGCVVFYAYSVMDTKDVDVNSSVRNVTLSSNCVPKVVFNDLSLTLEQVELVHNTLLHLDCEDQ